MRRVLLSATLLILAANASPAKGGEDEMKGGAAMVGDTGMGFTCDSQCPLGQKIGAIRSVGTEAPSARTLPEATIKKNLSRV